MTDTTKASPPREDITRPIVGIEKRTAQEVFDIMADRFRLAHTARPEAGKQRYTCTALGYGSDGCGFCEKCLLNEKVEPSRPDAGDEDVERAAELVDVMEDMWSLMRHEATCDMGCTCRYEPLAQRARALLPFRLDAKDAVLAAAASTPGAA